MQVKDIWQELRETAGTCQEDVLYRALTRAVELLANENSFDPLLCTVDFMVNGGYYIALPRDVKTPLRLNINTNPAFARNRIFEFTPNTPGSADGPEVGWQWHERGYSPIQDETKLPSKLRYNVTVDADIGKNATITGTDTSGRRRTETIPGANLDHQLTRYTYAEVLSVTRELTQDECYLWADTGSIARYYSDEQQPEYRVIKLSQTGVAVRMLYRRHILKFSSQEDIIPLHSAMAVIRAVDAVRLMQKGKYEEAKPILTEAVEMINKEQSARDEGSALSETLEIQTVTNTNILTNDVLIVADIYDRAAEILGGVGRQKVFDRITDAIEALQMKTHWDSAVGEATISRSINAPEESRNYGYFVLPRGVDAVLAINTKCEQLTPRNRWFEYHLNGPGWRRDGGSFHDKGWTPIINFFPRNGNVVIPLQVFAIAENNLDAGKDIQVTGIIRRSDGSEVGMKIQVPCGNYSFILPDNAPFFTRIDTIQRAPTVGFVRFYGRRPDTGETILLGFWQPDEAIPNYRMVRLPCCGNVIRILYRKKTKTITSLTDVLNLRSRLAIENMIRAIAKQAEDPIAAMSYEQLAVEYMEDEQTANNPHTGGVLQFEPGMAPGDFYSIQ